MLSTKKDTTDRDSRIASVWPFLIGQCTRFCRSLSPTHRAAYEVEDVLHEIWIELAVRDREWNPEKSQYISFAGMIAYRVMSELRDKAPLVSSATNSKKRLKKYEEQLEGDALTQQQIQTIEDIKRLSHGFVSIERSPFCIQQKICGYSTPLSEMINHENYMVSYNAILECIATKLTIQESLVIGLVCGVLGAKHTIHEYAFKSGKSVDEVKKIKRIAMRKIREHIKGAKKKVALNG